MALIRFARPSDANDLSILVTLFSGSPTSSDQILFRLNAMKDSEQVIVAELDNKVIGFGSLRLVHFFSGDNLYAEVTDLFVHPDFRRIKIAHQIMNFISIYCKHKGASEIVLITGFDNKNAQSFYKSIGYQDWALAMKKPL